MDCCDKAALLKSLRRRHQVVCSVIAILFISIGVVGVAAQFGVLLMSPLFIIAICVLIDAFLPRVSWFFCVRDVRDILGWRKR
ncbi:hypothetical protein KAM354_28220 [Aeromonas caviae]|nr:hypothetical protein KAM354_28220 [Aeromonas caviae]